MATEELKKMKDQLVTCVQGQLGDIAKVAMGMSGAQLPVEFTEGNLSVALNFKYDDAVKFEMKPNASITYEFNDSELFHSPLTNLMSVAPPPPALCGDEYTPDVPPPL